MVHVQLDLLSEPVRISSRQRISCLNPYAKSGHNDPVCDTDSTDSEDDAVFCYRHLFPGYRSYPVGLFLKAFAVLFWGWLVLGFLFDGKWFVTRGWFRMAATSIAPSRLASS